MSSSVIIEEPLPASADTTASILAIVLDTIGVDFSRYRAATIERRIRNRMMTVGARSHGEYLALVRRSREEVDLLAERLTIKVSRFYRNAATFDRLRHDVLPRLAAARGGRPLDVWVAGCGCGEEAYTLAMLLEERGWNGRVLATDIDRCALDAAGRGVYPAGSLQELPGDLAGRFLRPADARGASYEIADALRARVRLGRHDVMSGAPPGQASGFSLVSCRNVLIYFEKDAQELALLALRQALAPDGTLLLGEAEWLSPAVAGSLETVAHKARIFRAVGASSGEHR